jgi:hypothetical protein
MNAGIMLIFNAGQQMAGWGCGGVFWPGDAC